MKANVVRRAESEDATVLARMVCAFRDYYEESEVWDVSHPTDVVGPDGKTFELEHAWAENFVTMRSGEATGLAHFECVVFGG